MGFIPPGVKPLSGGIIRNAAVGCLNNDSSEAKARYYAVAHLKSFFFRKEKFFDKSNRLYFLDITADIWYNQYGLRFFLF